MGDYLFVTRYRDESHLELFVSMSGMDRFVQARFPFSEDKNYTHLDYHIIDVTEDGQVLFQFHEKVSNPFIKLLLFSDYANCESRSNFVKPLHLNQDHSI